MTKPKKAWILESESGLLNLFFSLKRAKEIKALCLKFGEPARIVPIWVSTKRKRK